MEWLPQTVPEQTRSSIIHGDFRIDNMIYAKDRSKVIAVIDWELATIGDPLADFAYLAMNWEMPVDGRSGLKGADLDALNIPKLKEVVDLYCELTDRDGVPDLHWYFAYNLFRLTAIVQGIKKRMLDGNASSDSAAKTISMIDAAGAGVLGASTTCWRKITIKNKRKTLMSLFDLTGKVALITGSSRGIGKATAIAMAEQGAKVVISSRKQDACDEAAKEINDRFGEGTAIAVAANISSKEALHNLVAETRNTFGKIDVLVCNAASNPILRPCLGHG